MTYDFLVLGSGIAGLSAALSMAPHGRVGILTKFAVKDSATHYAQGGIAVAIDAQDRPLYHFQDTLEAGDGLCNEAAVRVLVEEGPKRVNELIHLGAQFDQRNGQFDLTQEAAHGHRRILHAGDATGREIEDTLVKAVSNHPNIEIIANSNVIEFILDSHQRVIGCWSMADKELTPYFAAATVLATGGCGQLFERNSNPPGATGDGIAIAYRAGAALQDMEFIQFHPTTLYLGDKKPISLFLISEAVRGEGGILRNTLGEAFMKGYHPMAELAPRDEVARAIFLECQKTKSTHVFLDLSGLNMSLSDRFPTIYRRCIEANIDITREWIPVSPAAHYMMGGVRTDTEGRTSLSGLYAAGEVASTGLHGANRLASNSLLEGLVFGFRAGETAAQERINSHFLIPKVPFFQAATPAQIAQASQLKSDIRNWMWNEVGIMRSQDKLEHALAHLQASQWIHAWPLSDSIREVQNMLILATLITQAALNRTESRGAHFRTDYPERNDASWKIHAQCRV